MTSSVRLFVSMVAFLPMMHHTEGHIKDSIEPLVNDLWRRVAQDRDMITSPNIDSFLSRYDPNSRAQLDLDECQFKTGLHSWVTDFMRLGITTEYAAAYFWTLDVDGRGLFGRLTIEDLDEIVEICEKHSNRCYSTSSCRGLLAQEDFKRGFKRVIFRYLPFALMFVRYTRYEFDLSFNCQIPDQSSKHNNTKLRELPLRRPSAVVRMTQRLRRDAIFEDFQYEQMHRKDWRLLFLSIDQNKNVQIERDEMQHFWVVGHYGPHDDGLKLFTEIAEGNERISQSDWERLYDELDCRNHNNKLDVMEFFQLDLLLHGRKERRDGRCILKRS